MKYMNRTFVFLSRHEPTDQQKKIAAEKGITILKGNDVDAFGDRLYYEIESWKSIAHGIICVHPVVALMAHQLGFAVGVFNNINRAPIGEKPQFETTSLAVFEPARFSSR